jgi:hypothetical protein
VFEDLWPCLLAVFEKEAGVEVNATAYFNLRCFAMLMAYLELVLAVYLMQYFFGGCPHVLEE